MAVFLKSLAAGLATVVIVVTLALATLVYKLSQLPHKPNVTVGFSPIQLLSQPSISIGLALLFLLSFSLAWLHFRP